MRSIHSVWLMHLLIHFINFCAINWLGTINLLDVGAGVGQISFSASGQSSSVFMASAAFLCIGGLKSWRQSKGSFY